ncbi:MAG: START domain-containing protein [Leptospira sp.]|nr:START domain-containing protein [Leptospira sp.]
MNKTNLKIKLKLSIIMILCAQSLFSQSAEWKEAKKKNGITVFTREYKGSDVEEYLGKVELDASLSQIVSLLTDPVACDYIYHSCLEMTVLSSSNQKSIVYIRTGAPWPVANRDVVTERTMNQNPKSKVVNLRFQKTDAIMKASPAGVVRTESLYSNWRIIPVSSGKVLIEYQAHFEPGGSVPKSILNLVITNTPFNSLANIKKAVDEGKFKDTKLEWISEFE